MPSAPLWLRSPPWLQSFPPLPPAVSVREGAPSAWKPFLLHSSLPLVQVPSLFFCLCYFFFLLPYPSTGGVSCLFGGRTFSASVQWVLCRSSSTCRCISTVSVGRNVISASYSSAIFSNPPARSVFTSGAGSVERVRKLVSLTKNHRATGVWVQDTLAFLPAAPRHRSVCPCSQRGADGHWYALVFFFFN